jgi:hypothetical protein
LIELVVKNMGLSILIPLILDELDDKDDYYQMLQQKRKRRHAPTSHCFLIFIILGTGAIFHLNSFRAESDTNPNIEIRDSLNHQLSLLQNIIGCHTVHSSIMCAMA